MIYTLKHFTQSEIKDYFKQRIFNQHFCTIGIDYLKFFDEAVKEYKNIKHNTRTGITTNGKQFVSGYKYKSDIPHNPSKEFVFEHYIAHTIFCEAGRLYAISQRTPI